MTTKTRRCSRCGKDGHNARTCRAASALDQHDAERTLRLLLPSWIAVADRYLVACERVEALVTDELRAAWAEQNAAMRASNDVALTCNGLILSLPDERREELWAALRDGFHAYNEALNKAGT